MCIVYRVLSIHIFEPLLNGLHLLIFYLIWMNANGWNICTFTLRITYVCAHTHTHTLYHSMVYWAQFIQHADKNICIEKRRFAETIRTQKLFERRTYMMLKNFFAWLSFRKKRNGMHIRGTRRYADIWGLALRKWLDRFSICIVDEISNRWCMLRLSGE